MYIESNKLIEELEKYIDKAANGDSSTDEGVIAGLNIAISAINRLAKPAFTGAPVMIDAAGGVGGVLVVPSCERCKSALLPGYVHGVGFCAQRDL